MNFKTVAILPFSLILLVAQMGMFLINGFEFSAAAAEPDLKLDQILDRMEAHYTDKSFKAEFAQESTLKAMDRIIVLEDGQIAEEGTHEALLALGGIYHKFWTHQSEGFIS